MCNILLLNYAHAENKTPSIIVLGDSISAAYGINIKQGWVSLLQSKINTMGMNYQIINASISGDTTRTGLNRLKPLLEQHHPEVVIVALGGNDGLRGLAFTEIKSSLSKIINLSQQYKSKVVLAGVRLPPNYGKAYNKKFMSVFQKVARKYNIQLVTNILANVDEKSELMQADGIHPKAPAQPQMLENVWPKLKLVIKPN
jgi:acyl-CoA thioesterase-1